ncbi:MAG: ABC transporter ATP-binding protein, partial [Elusimicrobia bacterium]|nr:ABC transporter ATP-binding protein [Elusimicrobiota bacterium]
MKRAPKRCLVAILSATLALLSGGPVWAQGARLSRIAVGTPPASAVRFQTPTAPVGAAPALTLSALAPSLVAPAALTPAATPTAAAVAVTLAKPAAPAANAYAALRDAPPAASDGEKKEGEEAATEAAKPFEGKPAKDSAPPVAAKPSALKAFLFSSTAKARALAGDVRNMASGDKEIVPLLGGARTPGDTNHTVRQAQFLLVLDAVLCLGIAFIIGPLLNTAALAAKTGLAAQTPLLMTLGAALIGSSLIYALVERAHAYRGEAASYKSARDLRIALHKSLMSQSVDFHAKEGGSGKLAGRLLKDVGALSMKNTTLRLSLL